MKSFDSRTYSINDFVEWDEAKQLELNPRFQRRSVWSDKAKSFLIDTIIRGKPISKIFIRQKINVTTKTSMREVVDGQQRLRTILSFIKDGFTISKGHHKDFGGVFFSQMSVEIQTQLLSYEIAVDLLINLPDAEVLDIFGRLNSYAIVLNEQEKLNALHFGPFKTLSDDVARRYNEYWTKQKIFTPNQVLRMLEVNLTADLFIAATTGIKSKKQVGRQYERFEKSFPFDSEVLSERFDMVVIAIARLYPEGISGTELSRPFMFYTLFTTVFHCLYGLPGMVEPRVDLGVGHIVAVARNKLDRIGEIFETKDVTTLTEEERQFLEDSRRATTDEKVRLNRTKFMLKLIAAE